MCVFTFEMTKTQKKKVGPIKKSGPNRKGVWYIRRDAKKRKEEYRDSNKKRHHILA
jgi:hypothetical protein